MQVCYDSRKVALEFYTIAFTNILTHGVPFNFATDVICFENSPLCNQFFVGYGNTISGNDERAKIRRVVLNEDIERASQESFCHGIHQVKTLEEI